MKTFYTLVIFAILFSSKALAQGSQGMPTTPLFPSEIDMEKNTSTSFSSSAPFYCTSGNTCETDCSGSGWKIQLGTGSGGGFNGSFSQPDNYNITVNAGPTLGSFTIQEYIINYSWNVLDFGSGPTCFPFSFTTAGSLPSTTGYVSQIDIANLGPLADVCLDHAAFDLSNFVTLNRGFSVFNVTGQALFSRGVTITGPSVVNGVFNPAGAGVGTHTIVVQMPFRTGTKSYNIIVTVRPVPAITFSLPTSICSDAGIVNIDPYYSAVNGGTSHTFSSASTGFTGPSFFNPATASLGNNNITVSTTNNFGCTQSVTQTINVIQAFSVTAGTNQQVCANAAPINLIGESPSGGTWSGTGVSNGKFDPASLAIGTYTVTYTVNSGGCIRNATKTVQILALPVVTAGANLTACDNAGQISLATVGVSPSSGTWTFTDGSLNSRINNSSLTVDVNNMAAGVYTLVYSFTNASNCTNTASRTLTIVAKPVVVAGVNEVKCVNDTNYSLTGFSPAGGTWTGTGIVATTSVFSPATAGVGTWTLTYTYTNSATGCTNTATKTVTVNSLPIVSAGSNFSACVAGGIVALNGSPVGGTWSGPGISGNNFSPSAAGIGTFNLTYSFTNINACTNTATIVATVNGGPVVSAGPNLNTCEGAASFNITGGTPAGGTWSGPGVVAGNFNPILAGTGTKTLTYTYTDFAGCTGTATRSITVNPLPVVSAGLDLQVCYNGGLIALNDANVTPLGGTWTGGGVTGTNYDPVVAGTGNHIVTYTYTNANGCTASATRQILVRSTTPVNAGADLQACVSITSLTLTGQTPLGGTWSGTAVTGNIFNPSVAGVGTFVITYTITDGNGCPNLATRNVVVLPSPTVNAGGDQVACVSSNSLTLTGASPPSGTWSGPTVVGSVFNPALAGIGVFPVTYSFTNGSGCTASSTKNVTVNALPTVTVGSNFSSCINGANIPLTSGSPAGGTWSGLGVTSGQFNPGVAGAGNIVLTYTFTNGGGCTNSASLTATVNPLPTVSAGIDLGTCASVTNLNLTGGTPVGGAWSGPGVTGNIFNATIAGIGTSVITYTYTDANGCTNSATRNVTVTASPSVTGGADQAVCLNTSPFTITGGSPGGGTWSGTGVFNNIFDPSQSGLGTFSLTYTFNNGAGCSGTATKNIQVKSIPVVSAGSNLQYCLNAGIQNLTGGSPAGGIWSGTGVVGTTFNPFTAGVGNQVLTYSFTQNGCTNSSTTQVSVFAIPTVSAGPDLSTCVNNSSLNLTGASPAGGTWSGTAVTGNIFNATVAGIGTYILTYSYTDGNSCTVTATRQVTVNSLPVVNAGSNFSVCINSAPITLSGFSPTGGTWTGAGISGGNFSPALSGPGIFTLTYTFSNGSGCTVSSTRQATVYSLPTVTAGVDLTLCANSSITNLTGATPAGGTWSGSGVVGTSFNPGLVGAGIYSATYSYTDANSCTNTASRQVLVNSIPTVTPGPDLSICLSDQVNLTGATPPGGVWSGVGVTGNTFKGIDAGVGLQVLTYTVTGGNGCQNSTTRNVTVNPLPVVNGGGDLIVCINTTGFNITGGTPGGGTWSGTGVNNNIFTPSLAGLGAFTLTYSFTDNKSCTSTATKKITVTALPTVTAGANISVCTNTPSFTLTGASPAGGTWSGTGITGTTFNPLASGVGTFTATYSYTDVNGCANASSRTITVNSLPTVSAGPDLNKCLTDSFTLTGGSPAGGTWSGAGVTGNTFDASVAGIGIQILSYTFTNANGCTVTANRQIQVNPIPVVTAGSNMQVCKSATVTLNDGSPAGGTWSGPGVSGNTFNANFVSVGIQTLTYTFTTAAGCSATASKQITVNPLPVVSAGPDLTICQNSGVVALTGASPSGGTWSGSGVSGNNFNTSSVGIGSYVVTYSYTDVNGCSATSFRNIIVNSVPVVSVGADLNKCIGDIFTLSGASPSGGTWSGLGVAGNTFDATAAGVGAQVVTYTFTNAAGCTNSASKNINVNPLPVVNAGPDLSACANQLVSLVEGTPVGGVWSGPGVSVNVFNASQAGPGPQTLTYTYTNPLTGCSASKSRVITVFSLPTVSAGSDLSVCQGASPITLTGASPSGGTWSGPNVSGSTFNPVQSGLFTLTYSFTNSNGCTSAATRTVTVNSIPTVNAGADMSKCLGDVVNLTGASPAGGTWSGTGVTGSTFNTVTAGVGTTTLTYTVLSGTCSNTATRNIVVNALPIVSAGVDLTTCLNQNVTLNDGTPSGGTWSGPAVSGNTFNSALAGPGVQTLTYTYTNSITGCTNSATRKIAVNSLPVVSAGPDLTLCTNSGITFLTGGSPAGGTWSGTGVTAGSFNPASAGAGVQVITYSFTDGNGCSKSATRTIIVNSLPTVSAGPDITICMSQVINLTGASPAGGTWTGSGVTGNQFDSNVAGVGTQTLTYSFTNATGCTSSASRVITVNPIPSVQSGTSLTLCLNSPITVITGGTPVGGTWSGPGVTGSSFDPAAVGLGTQTIIYSYTSNGCTGTANKIVNVVSNPTVSAGPDLSTCIDAGNLALTGASPAGGTWSGPGVSGNNFNPLTAGVGSSILTYTYTQGAGCTGSSTRQITVRNKPTVNAGSDAQVCVNQVMTLSGASPSGGTWSGSGVTGNTFTASAIGTQVVTYSYTDANGCSNSATRNINVNPLPVIIAGTDQTTCLNSGLLTITDGSPTGGVWTGSGISNGKFDPTITGVGTFAATYTFVNANGCTNSASKNIIVKPIPTVDAGSNTSMCVNADIVILSGATPAGGTWTGPGVSGTTFNPSLAGVGNQVITYTYTGVNGCSASAVRQILVNNVPVVSGGSPFAVCNSQTNVNLISGTPVGGTWTGPGVVGSTFRPNQVSPGNVLLTYTYTGANGCSASSLLLVTVNAGPAVGGISDVDACFGGDPIPLNDGTPAGGVWSGAGVTSGQFRPKNTTIGPHTLTYTYTDPSTGCSGFATAVYTVNALPTVSAGQAKTLCISDNPYDLSVDVSPSGGSFSGTGVSPGTTKFSPSVAGLGTFRITYTYTDNRGCPGQATRDITVVGGLQQPTITGNAVVCYGQSGSYSATTPGANAFTVYYWYLDGDTQPFATGRTTTVQIFESTNIYVDAINTQGCPSTQRGTKAIISENIQGTIKADNKNPNTGDAVTFSYQGSLVSTYAWQFGDGSISSNQNPAHYYYIPGSYDVRLDVTSLNGCSATILNKNMINVTGQRFDPITGIGEPPADASISVYPHPFDNVLHVEISLDQDSPITTQLTSLVGINVHNNVTPGKTGENSIDIPTANLAQGMYILQVNTGKNAYSIKVVKK